METIGEPVLGRLKTRWKRLRKLPPGKRFQTIHREQRNRSPVAKAAFLGIALLSFAGGLVLMFIPGPAVLFFALAGALLATQSLWVARRLDQGEVWGRRAVASVRSWRRRRRRRSGGPGIAASRPSLDAPSRPRRGPARVAAEQVERRALVLDPPIGHSPSIIVGTPETCASRARSVSASSSARPRSIAALGSAKPSESSHPPTAPSAPMSSPSSKAAV